MNPFFNWLKDAETQAIELFITACAAIGALLLTWYFGKKSLSKRDLAEMEKNMAESSERLAGVHSHLATMNERIDTQEERDALNARINQVRMKVMGDAEQSKDVRFSITKQDVNVVLNRVDLYSEWRNKFGTALCEELSPPNQVLVNLDRETFMRWYDSGSLIGNLNQDRNLHLRVYFTFKGRKEEVYRPMTILTKVVPPSMVGQTMTPLIYRLFGEV